MPAIGFDRFCRYAKLTAILAAFAAERLDLVAVESIGRSHEGRDIRVRAGAVRAGVLLD